ncbi:hypothetical protein H0O00_00525 [Candidatus Micrarchaeota archaeon]|nr:hypothetical protein [Candidatus Micrarchaeota archaeon]
MTNKPSSTPDSVNILYIYDLNASDKKKFNRTKRLFYYHLGRLPLKKESWKTKSAFAVPPRMEKMVDAFFKRFGKAVMAYKAVAESIEELEN